MKVLIVEDEFDLMKGMDEYLKTEGFIVETASNYSKAHEKVFLYDYDCIVLDINLPDGTGLSLLEELKKADVESSVIIVSANNTLDDKLKGLALGADDYLPKPFHLTELNARIKAILRRNKQKGKKKITFEELTLHPDSKQAFVFDKPLSLTKKEYLLLEFFMVNPNKVISKASISEHLWGDYMDQADSYDFIYTHLKNLRRKIQSLGGKDYIKTVYGSGYIFE